MRLSRFDYLMLLLNIVAGMALIAAQKAPYVPPTQAWYLAIFGLAYPFIFLANCIFSLYWLFRKRVLLIMSLLFLFSTYGSLGKVFTFQPPAVFSTEQASIKVLTYNVQSFDVYQEYPVEDETTEIIQLIKREDPDIVILQEFYSHSEKFPNIDRFKRELGFKWHHFESTFNHKNTVLFGLATFSKFPLSEGERIDLKGTTSNLISNCVVEIQNKKYALFNVHLQSFKLGADDYRFIEEITDKGPDIESSKSLLRKLRNGYQKREKQVLALDAAIGASPYPVIVAGDFNDTPMSFVYETISDDLLDSFRETGFGVGGTYSGPLPSLRIDYIFSDSSLQVLTHKVIHEKYSDHYPVCSELILP